MTRVLFPGSFDPITKGHMNVIEQASDLFDEIVIAVLQNPEKGKGFFSLEERLELIEKIYEKSDKIKVISGDKTAFELAILNKCQAMLRGIRDVKDYVEEDRLQKVNRCFSNGEVKTVGLFAEGDYQYISSSLVRFAMELDKPIDKYVHPYVKEKMIQKKYRKDDEYGCK